MPQDNLDLAKIFQVVTQSLAANQASLNQSDTGNQDHGDNMVQTFQTITQALQKKKAAPGNEALKYAAAQVLKTTSSGSGKMYAQNLANAASQLKGKNIDAQGAVQLLQTLIGSSQPPQPAAPQNTGGDMLGALLGGLTGGQTSEQPSGSAGGDMLGALLGGLTGSNNTPSQGLQDGLDAGDLLNAGMAFLSAKQSGGNNMQALSQAFMAGSGMGNAAHRAQSTQIVVNSFLKGLSSLTAGKSQS